MMITLTDTSDDDMDVHINDWLVENDLAERDLVVSTISDNFVFKHYLQVLEKNCQNTLINAQKNDLKSEDQHGNMSVSSNYNITLEEEQNKNKIRNNSYPTAAKQLKRIKDLLANNFEPNNLNSNTNCSSLKTNDIRVLDKKVEELENDLSLIKLEKKSKENSLEEKKKLN